MPDKKVSQQTERTTAILGTDLLPMVGNVASTPANYKVQVKNFLSQIEIDLPQTTFSMLKITGAVTANATAAALTAAEFALIANSSVGVTVQHRYGLKVSNIIQNGNSNVTGQMVGAYFSLDVGNSNIVAANTFGLVIEHTLNANVASSRTEAPRAYLAILEEAGSGAKTSYLLDIGALGKNVSSNLTASNSSVIFNAHAYLAGTHALKISVNGQDLWLLASNVAPS